MPAKLEAQIDRIRVILFDLKSALVQEKERANALENELIKVKENLAKVQLQNADLTNELTAVNNSPSTNQQVIKESNPEINHRREEEIDALVKEIELCIRQLKDKHA